MENVITLRDVSIRYGRSWAVQDVTGSFARGSLTAIAGPNGAGKSTLLKAIAGILSPQKGRIEIAPAIRASIAYLPQASALDRSFPFSVKQAVATGFWPHIGDIKAVTKDLKRKVEQALTRVGLQDLADRQISALSGGQFQRLLFARVIVQDAQVILLDEPFAAVDAETTSRLMQILLEWHREGRTVVCVLHDLLLIHKYFPESFLLAGKCMGRGHTHKLFEDKLLSFDLDMAEIKTPEEITLCINESCESCESCESRPFSPSSPSCPSHAATSLQDSQNQTET